MYLSYMTETLQIYDVQKPREIDERQGNTPRADSLMYLLYMTGRTRGVDAVFRYYTPQKHKVFSRGPQILLKKLRDLDV